MAKKPDPPRWVSIKEALKTFALAEHGTQGQRHIKPLHWYVACRLVVEGGFHPDDIVPRPPFRAEQKKGCWLLHHDPDAAIPGERTVLGGLKTKDVDVVVAMNGIGPCVAVSMKGTLNAFRNLTNRMEEAAGDCTNVHIAYPALVYSFWNVMRANREGTLPPDAPKNLKPDDDGNCRPEDIAVSHDGTPATQIVRYHFALEGLTGRSGVREEPSRYEAVGLTLVSVGPPADLVGDVHAVYPAADSELNYQRMFEYIYAQYDLRFIYQAPALESKTRRLEWSPESPALAEGHDLDYEARVGIE